MHRARPIPDYLAKRYAGWKASTFEPNRAWYRHLAHEGQHPRAMIISCCDSRVNVTSLFGADAGDFFVHRNIASLVPPYEPDGDKHGTSAAIEYAVNSLKVAHVIVMGHSECGGVAGCKAMCSGEAPELEKKTSFVGRWMEILRPGYDRLSKASKDGVDLHELEHEAVRVSLTNLTSFPFVDKAINDGNLSIHGLWTDIGEGTLLQFEPNSGTFIAV